MAEQGSMSSRPLLRLLAAGRLEGRLEAGLGPVRQNGSFPDPKDGTMIEGEQVTYHPFHAHACGRHHQSSPSCLADITNQEHTVPCPLSPDQRSDPLPSCHS